MEEPYQYKTYHAGSYFGLSTIIGKSVSLGKTHSKSPFIFKAKSPVQLLVLERHDMRRLVERHWEESGGVVREAIEEIRNFRRAGLRLYRNYLGCNCEVDFSLHIRPKWKAYIGKEIC